ncbi:protocadherin beta-8-like isoform X1 [Ruditapes philippinarum]|uniref:protocadherin beta-8-like isoform X1 n=1 Tax=Ruditapes philippinarum TaxID=129788 RepID=UPI00295A73D7|nr:protocadherin beta-8-like isoform X1 [Ruditapes philippinarum]
MMLRSYITAVVLVACLSHFGDAAITGWTEPSTISGATGEADNIQIAEDTALEATIATFNATSDGTVESYELVTTDTPFVLNSTTGELTLSTALDFETQINHTIEVKATDSADAVGTATVVITVTDVNEAAPTFGATSFSVCVTDGSAAGTSIITFSATDTDTGDSIVYSIDSGNNGTDLAIAGSQLKVDTGKTLDKNRTDTYYLVILATDTVATVRSGSATYTINVETSCSRSKAAALTMTFMTLFLALIASLN